MDTVWTQYPATDHLGWGREFANKNTFEDSLEDHPAPAPTLASQSLRLAKFIDVAGQVVLLNSIKKILQLIYDLISSEISEKQQFHMQNKSRFAFSTGYNTISVKNLFKGITYIIIALILGISVCIFRIQS